MKRLFLAVTVWAMAAVAGASEPSAESLESEVKEIVAQKKVTVVHFWAPWCSNCRAEMRPDGWAKFVADNPEVTVVFLNIWHSGLDPEPALRAAKLGMQPNFVAKTHPNASRRNGEKLEQFLGSPVAWVPTTWVYREGKVRYALNYGEVRFDMLQQMVQDAAKKW